MPNPWDYFQDSSTLSVALIWSIPPSRNLLLSYLAVIILNVSLANISTAFVIMRYWSLFVSSVKVSFQWLYFLILHLKSFSDLILHIIFFLFYNFFCSLFFSLSFSFFLPTVLFTFSLIKYKHFLCLNPKLLNEFSLSIFRAVVFLIVYKRMKLLIFQNILRYFYKIKYNIYCNLYIELMKERKREIIVNLNQLLLRFF